ncbi:hypothetical protein [Marinibactrum halimedae]|uniref:Uncharacterized protein n=1 Tax=Marinibactrum halimedae TaxID=1444977 RepID=A0AA37TAD7_9GAMM|nr:hypothetical protein [Marinibactrum halimedae]MCD9460336.1 hypothetical protein [Marinibactrum halimedae]GLS26771.1 hypothetical protein GCM10007877_24900 [Marinibactrum halimedae]
MARKEPTLSGISTDDLGEEPLRRSTANRSSGSKKGGSSRAEQPPRSVSYDPAPSGSKWTPVLFVVAVAALGLSGFLFMQLTQAQVALQGVQLRLTDLEQQLTLTDDEASQSVTALQANLKKSNEQLALAHSEIRKLWDTRKVNKKGIASNASAAKSAASTANSAKQSLTKVESSLSELKATVSSLSQSVNTKMASVDSLQSEVKSLSSAQSSLKSSFKQVDNLSSRVQSNEDAIESIDAYRRNINRQLLELQQRGNSSPATP